MTIEERARNYSYKYSNGLANNAIAKVSKTSYKVGATSQRRIDISKACDWLKNNYGYFDGKVEDFVADFEKAMYE